MATCPAGHESASADYCDTCGIRIGGPAPDAAAQPPGPGGVTPARTAPLSAQPAAGPCPNCGTERSGQFCEACGFDFNSGRAPSRPAPAPIHGAPTISAPVIRRRGSSVPVSSPPAGAVPDAPDAARWSAIVTSDRAYYDSVVAAGGTDAATIKFPEYCPERRFQLTGPQMRIGRVSPSRGFEPEIDLTGPPTDPGVSRLHAVLIPESDGTWAILDPGSENGTHVNDVEIASDQRVRLRAGDRIHLGAWTILTIRAT
jgi:FHA domain